MIQRIQSLYLLLTTILPFLFLKGGILSFAEKTGSEITVRLNGIFRSTEFLDTSWLVTLFIILIAILSAIIIGIFKKRELQLKLSRILVFLVTGFITGLVLYAYAISVKYNAEIKPAFTMAVPILQLVFSFLAFRGIKKDDDLVKSYDRLR
jgi:glucan phosphoethanolaminetransferase (alkaline phosphatase superfamily)